MEEAVISALPQLGVSIIFLAMAIYLFRFLMDSNLAFRNYLMHRNNYLEEENKQLRQALFASKDPDLVRLSASLLARSPKTNLGEE